LSSTHTAFWSQISIPGRLRILLVDGSRNIGGWEADFCERVFRVLDRKNVALAGDAPVSAHTPSDLVEAIEDYADANCVMLFCHGSGRGIPEESALAAFWARLSTCESFTPKLLAVCTWEVPDEQTSRSILQAGDGFAQLALAPHSPLSPRAAGLFFMKFLTELDLHSHDSVTGKMVWFSSAKAREILKRRQLPGEIGVRC
jgi:hypothetical protein